MSGVPPVYDHRRAALRLRLLVAGTVVGAVVWLVAGGWRLDRDAAVRSFLLGIALPMVVFAWLVTAEIRSLGTRRRPTSFLVRTGADPAFVVPPTRWFALQGVVTFVLGAMTLGMPLRELFRAADGAPGAFHLLAAVVGAMGLLVVAMSLLLAGLAWASVPRLELRPDGVRDVYAFGRQHVPWEAVPAGQPMRQPLGPFGELILPVARRELIEFRGWMLLRRPAVTVANTFCAIHPWFLADAIRHYVDHPEHRPVIGTHAEHERLRAALYALPRPEPPR